MVDDGRVTPQAGRTWQCPSHDFSGCTIQELQGHGGLCQGSGSMLSQIMCSRAEFPVRRARQIMPEAEKMQLCLLWRTQNVGNTGTMGCLGRVSSREMLCCAADDGPGPEEGK